MKLSVIKRTILFTVLAVGISTGVMAQDKFMKETVVISTIHGDIHLKLYNDTPLHGNNFIKLASSGFFDSTLFHRVITGFMIQGGDPDSKGAKPGIELGNGGPGYDIPAEITPTHMHVKGVLAAAREGDDVNPLRMSSGSQFYIVQGKVFTDSTLDIAEARQNNLAKQALMKSLLDKPENASLKSAISAGEATKDSIKYKEAVATINSMVEEQYKTVKPYVIAPEKRAIYKTVAGAPHLDGKYTIFGEVIKGIEVVDKIAAAKRDERDRPLEDIQMKVSIL